MDREQYLAAIESSILSLLKSSIIKIIVTRIPILAWGPLAPILSYVVSKLLELGAKEAKLMAFFIYTDLRTNFQAKDFESAAIKFNLERNPENEKKMLDAFYRLANLNG